MNIIRSDAVSFIVHNEKALAIDEEAHCENLPDACTVMCYNNSHGMVAQESESCRTHARECCFDTRRGTRN